MSVFEIDNYFWLCNDSISKVSSCIKGSFLLEFRFIDHVDDTKSPKFVWKIYNLSLCIIAMPPITEGWYQVKSDNIFKRYQEFCEVFDGAKNVVEFLTVSNYKCDVSSSRLWGCDCRSSRVSSSIHSVTLENGFKIKSDVNFSTRKSVGRNVKSYRRYCAHKKAVSSGTG